MFEKSFFELLLSEKLLLIISIKNIKITDTKF